MPATVQYAHPPIYSTTTTATRHARSPCTYTIPPSPMPPPPTSANSVNHALHPYACHAHSSRLRVWHALVAPIYTCTHAYSPVPLPPTPSAPHVRPVLLAVCPAWMPLSVPTVVFNTHY